MTYHVVGEALEVVEGGFQGVGVYVQDHDVIQGHVSDFLQIKVPEEKVTEAPSDTDVPPPPALGKGTRGKSDIWRRLTLGQAQCEAI